MTRNSTRPAARLPAEWEPQRAVWLTRPHNPETWPGVLDAAVSQWRAFAEALSEAVRVRVTQDEGIATQDAWVRDYGPLFVEGRPRDDDAGPADSAPEHAVSGQAAEEARGAVALDFRFNAWGRKYEPFDLDDAAGAAIALAADRGVRRRSVVLEGGAIDADGRGTLLTTRQCLLHPNRNPHANIDAYERLFHDDLGVDRVIWLPGGIDGDDTDGHVDDVARFLAPGVVACVCAPPDHPDHDVTRRNARALRAARDAADRPLTVVELPAPEPMTFDYPPDRFGPGGRSTLPASYANFLISNGRVFVPTFGQVGDERALDVLDRAMPDHRVVPVRADTLVVGLGTLHCLSMHEPETLTSEPSAATR